MIKKIKNVVKLKTLFPHLGPTVTFLDNNKIYIEPKVGLCTCFYVIHYNFKTLMIDYMSPNNNKAGKSGSNLKDSILTSQKKKKRKGKRKRLSTEKVLEGFSKQITRGRKLVNQEIPFVLFIVSHDYKMCRPFIILIHMSL